MQLAGSKPDKIIDDTALEVLARGTHGIPRCLNQAAHQAFTLADDGELPRIDAEAALEALSMLGLAAEEEDGGETALEGELPHIQSFIRSA